MGKINRQVRISKEFRDLINFIRAKYIIEGKRPPNNSQITKMIAKKINKEDLLQDVFIKF